MKLNTSLRAMLIAMSLLCFSVTAHATLGSTAYNQTQNAIFGSGNPDGSWVMRSEPDFNLQLGLRAKDRSDGSMPNNGLGTYTFLLGSYPGPVRARWNWEFSINADPALGGTQKLTNYDFYVSMTGPSFSLPPFNVLNAFGDNSYGDSSTANGAGVEGLASVLAGTSTIAQNSENIAFIGGNPNVPGLWSFALFATAPGAGMAGTRVAEVDIWVNVVSAVPEPSSVALLGIGSVAIASRMRRRQR